MVIMDIMIRITTNIICMASSISGSLVKSIFYKKKIKTIVLRVDD